MPETVAMIVEGPPSRLSTLIELVNVPALTMSIDVSVPSDGSNWPTVTDCVQSVLIVGIVADLARMAGVVSIVLSVVNL